MDCLAQFILDITFSRRAFVGSMGVACHRLPRAAQAPGSSVNLCGVGTGPLFSLWKIGTADVAYVFTVCNFALPRVAPTGDQVEHVTIEADLQ